ncbi:MAG TPA: hypothetical protein VL326_35550 [Kofleriaceae bacterium]|nr:hypothetical protein [Kofleriaceae bacterium]
MLACAGGYGVGDGNVSPVQTMVPATGTWADVTVGEMHKCASDSAGLACWGENGDGQLGNGTQTSSYTPVRIGSGAMAAIAASLHTCAIDASGQLGCWGQNQFGETGQPASPAVASPQIIAGVWSDISVGRLHTVGISGGVVKTWGRGDEGALGDGVTSRSMPTAISGNYVAAWAGGFHTCALDGQGMAWCWGLNSNGQLGVGDGFPHNTPTSLGSQRFRQLAPGTTHTCGITTDGALWCWGSNSRGELGVPTATISPVPLRVGTDTDWQSVTSGSAHSCAVKTDASAWCWGDNDTGELADGTAWRQTLEKVP